jgi:hypothetical protein|tara:strand:- start:31587 stop:32060 length:474 start_codon:yes stop_codon:yes gene_type:complete
MVLMFLFFTILAAGAQLIPSYFISESKESATREHSDIIKESVAKREQEVSSTVLLETKEKLKLLSFDEKNISLKDLFERVLDNKLGGVGINGIFYKKSQFGKETEMLVTGEADSRESLLEFKKLLEREKQFRDVELPVSNLASDRDIKFSIKITGNF